MHACTYVHMSLRSLKIVLNDTGSLLAHRVSAVGCEMYTHYRSRRLRLSGQEACEPACPAAVSKEPALCKSMKTLHDLANGFMLFRF